MENQKSFKLLSFSKQEIGKGELGQIARLYCEVWKEFPWLEEWEQELVLTDIQSQLTRPGAQLFCCQLFQKKEIIGFTWGYLVSREDFQSICGKEDGAFIFDENEKVFYIDELAVCALYRRKKVGRQLSQAIIGASGAEAILLRTDKRAIAATTLYEKMDFMELPLTDAVYSKRTYWILKI